VSGAVAGEGPEAVIDRLVASLNGARLQEATRLFARDGCFVTPDSTLIRGREDVGSALGQLVSIGFQVQLHLRAAVTVAGVALVSDQWTTTLRGGSGGELRQGTRGTALVGRIEDCWRLLLVAPWGWAEQSPLVEPHLLVGDR
jgi:hypothetical protein